MAGSINVITTEVTNNLLRYRVEWTSDASGDVNTSTFAMMPGTIIAVEFFPGTGGFVPTSQHDANLVDANGLTLFDDGSGTSIGNNLSDVLPSHKVPMIGLIAVTVFRRWFHGGTVQPTVSGAGNGKKGTMDIYVAPGVL